MDKKIEAEFKKLNEALAYINKFVEGGVFEHETRLHRDLHDFLIWKNEQYKLKELSGEVAYGNISHTIRNVERLSKFLNDLKVETKGMFITETYIANDYGLKQESYTKDALSIIFDVSLATVDNWFNQDTHPLKRGAKQKGKPLAIYRTDIIEFLNHNPKIKVKNPDK